MNSVDEEKGTIEDFQLIDKEEHRTRVKRPRPFSILERERTMNLLTTYVNDMQIIILSMDI